MEISLLAKELLKGVSIGLFIFKKKKFFLWLLLFNKEETSYDNEDTKSSFMNNVNKSTLQMTEKTPNSKNNNI